MEPTMTLTQEEAQKIAQEAYDEASRQVGHRELVFLQGGPYHNLVAGVNAGAARHSRIAYYERSEELTTEGRAIFYFVEPS